MSAIDQFEEIVAELADPERESLAEFIKSTKSDLFAARSEDARLRIVSQQLERLHDLLARHPRKG